MTAFETQIYGAAKMLAEKTAEDVTGAERVDPEDVDLLCQRFACLMIQARAQECRKLAGSLLLDPSSILRAGEPKDAQVIIRACRKMSQDLEQRSHDLELLAMRWAEKWPPEDKPAPGKLVELPDGMVQ
jgi:hypothetical protein